MSDIGPSGERLARAVRAAHDLSDVLWESLHEGLAAGPDAQRASQLAQRLADVCSAIALLAVESESALRAPPHKARETAPETPPETPLETPLEPPDPSSGNGIEVHDARPPTPRHVLAGLATSDPGEGPAAWIASISRRLHRHREDRLPFAVLLVEVLDIDRLLHAEPPEELTRLTDHVERAIGAELRPADLLTREALGRYWLITPETDAPGAHHLAERLVRTVRLSARHRGVPLELAIGIAVCPDDGRDAAGLAAHADVGVYAARAAGVPVAPVDDPAA